MPDRAPSDAPVHDPLLPNERGIDGERLRAVMRRVASPVTIVTVAAGGERRAATIGSFTSVSLDPPLVSFNATQGTGFHHVLRQADRFAVHLLRDDQSEWAEHFAQPDYTEAQLFDSMPLLEAGREGVPPVLEGTLGVLHCSMWAVHPVGDHSLIVGKVLRVDVAPVAQGVGPLLYYARSYRGVGERV